MFQTLSNPRSVFARPRCETLSYSRSLSEALGGCAVVVSGQEEVVVRIFSSQGIKADLAFGQIDFGADQAVDPDGTDVEGVSEYRDLSFGVGFSDVDHGSFQRLLQVQSPVFGKRSACGSIFDAHRVASSVCGHEAVRLSHDIVSFSGTGGILC